MRYEYHTFKTKKKDVDQKVVDILNKEWIIMGSTDSGNYTYIHCKKEVK